MGIEDRQLKGTEHERTDSTSTESGLLLWLALAFSSGALANVAVTSTLLGQEICSRLLFAVVMAVFALAFLARAIKLDLHRYKRKTPGQGKIQKEKEFIDATNELPSTVAHTVLNFIASPSEYIRRIKESVEPLNRAVLVTTKYTVRVPPVVEHGDSPVPEDVHRSRLYRFCRRKSEPVLERQAEPRTFLVYIPFMLSKKGDLHDDLTVKSEGRDIATLTFNDSLSVIASSMRTLVRSLSAGDAKAYYGLEEEILAQIANRRTPSMSSAEASSLLVERIRGSMTDSMTRGLIESMLDILTENYVLVAVVKIHVDGPETWIRITTTERMLLTHEHKQDRATRIGNRFRRVYGVRTSKIYYPLTAGWRAASYHLEIMGPAGTYLARQELLPEEESAPETAVGEAEEIPAQDVDGESTGYRRLQSRMGQRYLHFYARGLTAHQGLTHVSDEGAIQAHEESSTPDQVLAPKVPEGVSAPETAVGEAEEIPAQDVDGESTVSDGRATQANEESSTPDWVLAPKVVASFHERPPGSMSHSAVSAIATLLLLVAAARMSTLGVVEGRGDVVVLMLAIPGAVASWSGFERAGQSFGGTLCSRVSSSVTLATCLAGALQYLIGGEGPAAFRGPVTAEMVWGAILAVAMTNAMAMSYAWFKRWLIHGRIMSGIGSNQLLLQKERHDTIK